MKVMLDTNVLISALVFGGTPNQLIKASNYLFTKNANGISLSKTLGEALII